MPVLSAAVLAVGHSRGTARALPSVFHNGQQHVVAEPNEEFQVQVSVAHPQERTYRVSLLIDGESVRYRSFASRENSFSTTFPGWYHNAGDGQIRYRHFKFGKCRPAANATTVEHPDQIVAGKIEVKCDAVIAVDRKEDTRYTQHVSAGPLGNAAASKKLPEGKKWFLQPGLKAETGSLSSRTDRWNTKRYEKLHELVPLKIKYDTAENLKLRNILKPANPQHAAILQSSSNPRVAALLGASSSRPQHHPSSSRRQPKREQNRKGSKRKHAQQSSESDSNSSETCDEDEGQDDEDDGDEDDAGLQIPRSATGEVVNLCEEDRPEPLKVNGRVLQSDELAICDLCDSDGGRHKGKWKIKKKPRITIG